MIEPQINQPIEQQPEQPIAPQMEEIIPEPSPDIETPELPEERQVGLLKAVSKMFIQNTLKSQERGKKDFIVRQAANLDIDENVAKINAADITRMDETDTAQINFDIINDADDVKAAIGQMNIINREAIQTQRRHIITNEEMDRLSSKLMGHFDTMSIVREPDGVVRYATKKGHLTTNEGRATEEEILSLFGDEIHSKIQAMPEGKNILMETNAIDIGGIQGAKQNEVIAKILRLKPGELVSPEMGYITKKFFIQSGRRLTILANKVKDPLRRTPEDVIAFHKQSEFHGQFAKQFMGIRAEYSRGMRAVGMEVEENFPLDDMMARLSSGNFDTTTMANQILAAGDSRSLAEVTQIQRKGFLGRTSDIFYEVFINGILSGTQTNVVNACGNTAKTATSILDTAVASRIKVGGENLIEKGEATEQLQGMWEGQAEALKLFFKTFYTEENYGGIARLDYVYDKKISASGLNIPEGKLATTVNLLGRATRATGTTLMAATDAYFKRTNERGKLRQLASREARQQNLTGRERDDFMAFRMANPTDEMTTKAHEAGLDATFQRELGETGKDVQRFARHFRYFVPFVRTPINIVYEGVVERTPIALMSNRYKDAIAKGGEEAQMAKAKMRIGTTINAMFGAWGFQELSDGKPRLTGAYPRDRKMRQAWRDAKIEEYSFVFYGENGEIEYQSFDRVEPYNTALKFYSNISQTIRMLNRDGRNPDAEKEIEKAIGGVALAMSEATVNQTWMTGVKQLTDLAFEPDLQSTKYISRFINSVLVPNSGTLRNIAKEIDPTIREAHSIVDKLKKNIPGLGKDLPPQLDNFGKKQEYDHNFLPKFMQGIQEKDKDFVRSEVARLTEITKSVAIYKPAKTTAGYRFTPQEYFYYTDQATNVKRNGKTFYEAIKDVMRSIDYKSVNDYVKSDMLKMIRNVYYDMAKEELLQKYPHIRKYFLDKEEYKNKLLAGE